jgi:hypothetical protein
MKYFLLLIVLLSSYYITIAQSFTGSVSRGKATIIEQNIFPSCSGSRPSVVGKSTSSDNKEWIVPAETVFLQGPYLSDFYNQCNNITPSNINAVNINNIPIKVIDEDGEIITGYVLSDNYCEVYINGILIGADPVPFTPFNSCLLRFKAKKPYTIAVKLVDWEENSGLGTENNNGNLYHAGDAGFIARFSDGTISDTSWKAQVYYISPLMSPDSIIELSNNTRYCKQLARNIPCADSCYAVHYPLPNNWQSPTFDDSMWPKAYIYTPETVGVNFPAWTNFTSFWTSSSFIWTSNLVVDNLVLARKTVGSNPSSILESTESKPIISVDNQHISIIPHQDIHHASIQLFSLVGNCISSIQNVQLIAGIPYQLPISNTLPSGVYYFSIYDSKTPVCTSTLFIH